MIFDLRDVPVTTPETDRRRRRFTILVVTVFSVVLAVLFVAGIAWIRDALDQSETRVKGEQVLAAVAWPQGWQPQPTSFRAVIPFGTDSHPHWDQEITTNEPDLSTADGAVRDSLTAAGWAVDPQCGSTSPVEVTCRWASQGYVLYATVKVSPSAGTPCPEDPAPCAQVRVTLTPVDPGRT